MIHDHEKRRLTIGASEIAAILGLSEYQTPLDVWLVKTGRKPPFEGNEHTRRGNRQERQILEWLAEDLGINSFATFDSSISGICPFSKIATATPDGFFCVDGKIELGEAKSTLKAIRTIEDVPHWWLQCQWQMLCTGLKKCHLAIFGPLVSNYQRFEIEYNEDFAIGILKDAEEWWQRHVIEDIQPDPINESDVLTLWPIDDGSSIEAVEVLADAVAMHSFLKAQIKELEAKIQPLRESIVLAIGAAEKVKYSGRTIATYKANKAGSRVFKTF